MIWEQQQLESVAELRDALTPYYDDPVYMRTPHGSYYFVVQDVERVVVEGEQRTVIVMREVEWAAKKPCPNCGKNGSEREIGAQQ